MQTIIISFNTRIILKGFALGKQCDKIVNFVAVLCLCRIIFGTFHKEIARKRRTNEMICDLWKYKTRLDLIYANVVLLELDIM